MKKRIFSSLLIFSILLSTVIFRSPVLSAKENNEVANLALMLPDSDVIVAVDMDKTLNVVGPSLLNQDAKKIENLKKLMKSLENVIGLNPYEIKQMVAGVKLPSVEEKNFFDKIDFTVVLRTARSNNALLEDWSKKMDAIETFNDEKDPTEKYIDAFKTFRYYKLSDDENKEIAKLSKEFEEIVKKIGEVDMLLSSLPASVKVNTLKDLLKKNKNTVDSIIRFQTLLKKDSDEKTFRDSSIKLQNRWYEVDIEDAKRVEKLDAILKDSKGLYPVYKAKVENVAKIDALIHISNYEFYDKLTKKNFGLPDINDDVEKDPNEMMKDKLAEVVKTLSAFPSAKAKQTTQLRLVSKNLQKLENGMSVWLKIGEGAGKFEYLNPDEAPPTKTTHNLSKSIKENAKISEVNGKRLITMDLEKVNLWNAGIETPENEVAVADAVKVEPKEVKNEAIKQVATAKDKKDEHFIEKKDEKKKEHFAIGYLDDKTMVLGFESGIRSILNRKEDFKNPRAAEMLNSFKNPLVSFAMNSKIFQNFTKAFEPPSPVKKDEREEKKEEKKVEKSDEKVEKVEKKVEKKQTPSDKFFSDINIFGALEYDGDSAAANDLIMSLGFTKNQVEDVFSIEADEEESSVFEVGDYQISKAIFYDLLNTLKAFKASVSFKFEKKKVAALIESAPQMIEDIRFQKASRKADLQIKPKTKIQNFQNIEELLTSPKFYADLFGMMARKSNN